MTIKKHGHDPVLSDAIEKAKKDLKDKNFEIPIKDWSEKDKLAYLLTKQGVV